MSKLVTFKKIVCSSNPIKHQIIFSRSISFSEIMKKEQIEPMQHKRHEDFKDKIVNARNKLKWRNDNTQTGNEWYSKLSLFTRDREKDSNSRYLTFVAQPIDLTPKSIKKWYQNKKVNHEKIMQSFIPERLEILGNDLTAAHFLVHRGGAIRFTGSPNWIKMDENDKYSLPGTYDANLTVEEIKCDNMQLYYEGLENVRRLKHLKSISFKNVVTFDDWCLDRFSGSEFDSLERLDLSGTSVTFNGLAALYRIPTLTSLILDATPEEKKEAWLLTVSLLEELNVKLKVTYAPAKDNASN